MQPLSDLSAGRQVGRFTLLEFLGEGGMGSVWTAEDPTRKDETRDGRIVLKFLRDDIRRCPQAVQQFSSSYRKVQQLHHEHICPMLDLGEDPLFGSFQVMHLVAGVPLDRLIIMQDPDRTGLPVETVLNWLTPVAKALDYAHRHGIVHRDIKPGNIIVDPVTGEVHVVDFGLAAEVRTSMSRHSRSVLEFSGTEPYMAPEQWQGQPQDGRSDQYSLAVVAWELLTGDLPYQGSGMQLGFAVANGPIPELPDQLAALQPVFTMAMAKDRKQRFGNATAFLKALSNPSTAVSANSSLGAIDVSRKALAAVPSPSDDLAALLQQTQESVARKHAQAKQLVQQDHQYAAAAEILSEIPEHLRDSDLFAEATTKRDRVQELDASIRQAVRDVRTDGLREQVAELLELQPHRDDMPRLLAQLPKEPPKPSRPALLVAPFDVKQAAAAQQAWAKHLGIDVEVTNSLGMKFRVIPPGTFDMGSPTSEPKRDNDETHHKVTITQPKLLGVYPVTQGEWTKVTGSNPSHFKSVSGQDARRFPVEQVSWEDAQKFLTKLNSEHTLGGWRYRLPTEAEWEYACRAGTVTPFWFGGELNGKQANCDGRFPYESGKGPYLERPSVVGAYKANPFGLYDQHGQVSEWCEDWYGEYDTSASQDPTGASSGSSRVLRGGSWNVSAFGCRSAFRFYCGPSFRSYRIGFRVVCELS